jgi:hypothetical protein
MKQNTSHRFIMPMTVEVCIAISGDMLKDSSFHGLPPAIEEFMSDIYAEV